MIRMKGYSAIGGGASGAPLGTYVGAGGGVIGAGITIGGGGGGQSPDIGLSQKEWDRIVKLIGGEFGKTENEIIAWINDDEAPTWQTL